MAGESKCFSLVRGRSMRVTKTDGCGAPQMGAEASVVSDGFISVALTANTDEGTTISVQNAAGKTCILDEPCPTFTGYSVEVQFCEVDPALFALMSGQAPVSDADGGTVGFRVNSGVDACGSGFALELWSQVPAGACEPGTGESFGYFLVLPAAREGWGKMREGTWRPVTTRRANLTTASCLSSSTTCWYRTVRIGCDHPRRSMTVLVSTPATSKKVAAVCLASCKRASRTPASASTRFHSSQSRRGSIGLPIGLAKILPLPE